MGFGFGRLSASPSGLTPDDFAAILTAAQPGAPAAPRQPFGFGPLVPPAGAPMAMPPAPGGNLTAAASLFGGGLPAQPDPRADMPDAGAAPAGKGFSVEPRSVAAIRAGFLRQAPGGVVPLPSEAPEADVPSTGAIPIAGQAPVAAPAPAAAEPSTWDRFIQNGGGDLLGSLGIGLLSTKGLGAGLATGLQLAQAQQGKRAASDLARAELGLKQQKIRQEVAGQNQTEQFLRTKGYSAEDARGIMAAAAAGNREALSNALSNLVPKNPEVPWSYQRNPDGSVRATAGGSDDPAVLRARAQAQAEGAAAGKPDDPFNLSPGQTRFDASGNPLVSVPDRSKLLEQSGSIRKEIHTLPSYKNYSQALPVYQGMLETADRDSKASDLNLIYGLGKIMDPGSVVREGELRLAQDTQGVADRLIGMYNGVMGGARLSPQARQQLLAEAYGRIESYEQAYGQDRRGYEGIVARQGMDPNDVLPSFAPVKPYQPARRAQTGGAPDGAVRALQSDPGLRDQFEAKYGRGSADRYLGGR